MSITKVSIEVKDQQLERIPSIQYLVKFKKSHIAVQVLLDSGNEVNVMILTYTAKLKLRICSINVGAQKIDVSTFLPYGIVLANF